MKPLHLAAMLAVLAGPLCAQDAPVAVVVAPAPVAVVAPTVSGTAVDAASTGNSLGDLVKWLGTQQAQLGTSIGFSKVKYVTTWWDAVSFGQKGLNVGLASAKDYLDLGLGTAAANQEATRYGFFVPVHVGNIVNTAGSWLPAVVADHVHLTTLPNVTLALVFLYPQNGVLKDWTFKKDGQGAVAYRFGGAN